MNDTVNELPAPPELTPAQRKELKARAHHLKPVVMIGESGVTDGVVAEAERAIAVHELIKVSVAGDDRDERRAAMHALATRIGAAPVQIIGKQLIVYRPSSNEDAGAGGRIKRSGPYVPKKAEAVARGSGRAGGERKGATLKGTKGAKARKAFADMVASSANRPPATRAGRTGGPASTPRARPAAAGAPVRGATTRAAGDRARPHSQAPARRPATGTTGSTAGGAGARGSAPRPSASRAPAAAPRSSGARAPAARSSAGRAAPAPRTIGGLRPRGGKSKG